MVLAWSWGQGCVGNWTVNPLALSEGEQRHPMLVSTSRIQLLASKYHSLLKGSQLLGEMAGSEPGAGHV